MASQVHGVVAASARLTFAHILAMQYSAATLAAVHEHCGIVDAHVAVQNPQYLEPVLGC
jgi:hypothetical protein